MYTVCVVIFVYPNCIANRVCQLYIAVRQGLTSSLFYFTTYYQPRYGPCITLNFSYHYYATLPLLERFMLIFFCVYHTLKNQYLCRYVIKFLQIKFKRRDSRESHLKLYKHYEYGIVYFNYENNNSILLNNVTLFSRKIKKDQLSPSVITHAKLQQRRHEVRLGVMIVVTKPTSFITKQFNSTIKVIFIHLFHHIIRSDRRSIASSTYENTLAHRHTAIVVSHSSVDILFRHYTFIIK